jgi:hypothetical protein
MKPRPDPTGRGLQCARAASRIAVVARGRPFTGNWPRSIFIGTSTGQASVLVPTRVARFSQAPGFLRESAPERVSIPRSRQIATEAVRIKAPMTCAAKARSLIAHSGSMCQDDD